MQLPGIKQNLEKWTNCGQIWWTSASKCFN